ncbi:MAG: SpoIIE family protein phosphatase [Acidobacteria bacterium]|nr:SpoIIE family protein phosphatase [Acidobacteriota bacterium]MBU1475268.1 SpoIIE family protein phosphatase [Acidobacteriota bacterium]
MSTLYIYPKKGNSFRHVLTNEKITLGRQMENSVFIPDPFCSSNHAVIYPRNGDYVVRDNGSKNGTFLNGQKITAEIRLKKGDEILIGSTRIFFDKELSTDVELTDLPSASANINTIMHLEEVFKKPDVLTTVKAQELPADISRLKAEHKAFAVISEVSRSLVLHMPLNELMDHIMDLISDNLPMDRGILMLKEGNPVQLIPRVVRVKNDSLRSQKILVSQSIINMAIDNHSSILISDVQADPLLKSQESIIKLNIHSAMCVPLWNNKEITGIIYADRISIPDNFDKEDLKLLTLLSNLAAVKIENSKLIDQSVEKQKMERELDLAANIQRDFLPDQDPECENYDIAGGNLPCHQVGGDYYDFLKIDDGRFGFVVADVSGKGVSASLLMASLRAAIHSEVHAQYDIKKMARKLNNFVHASSAINHFITFFFCELNRETGELQFINAGHNPPLVFNKKCQARRLESCGLCLGMFPDVDYEVMTTVLDKGDIALLFTDGITESRNKAQEEFGEKRLFKLCKKYSKLSAREILDNIYGEVEAFTGGGIRMDDMTIVIIKRVG